MEADGDCAAVAEGDRCKRVANGTSPRSALAPTHW